MGNNWSKLSGGNYFKIEAEYATWRKSKDVHDTANIAAKRGNVFEGELLRDHYGDWFRVTEEAARHPKQEKQEVQEEGGGLGAAVSAGFTTVTRVFRRRQG